MGLTKAERQKAVDLIQRVLDLVDDRDLAADGPAGVALIRDLAGSMVALRTLSAD